MTGDHEIERTNPLPAKVRKHHAPPGITDGGSRATVYDRPSSARRAEHDGVPLPHIQHVEPELPPTLT